jgi:hypothetical protein
VAIRQLNPPLSHHAIRETLKDVVDDGDIMDAEKLPAMDKLSDHFPEPVTGMLHLVVKVPSGE